MDIQEKIHFPGTDKPGSPWQIYNDLIPQIPEDICVKDYCTGYRWAYVEADCGMGIAYAASGGRKGTYRQDMRGMSLKEVAELSKSWCMEEASIGVAALNAWFNRKEMIESLGGCVICKTALPDGKRNNNGKKDAFQTWEPVIKAAPTRQKVVAVGHFPHIEDVEEYADLTVLERRCRDAIDTPDSGCEFELPDADYAFITGLTLVNKTYPRLTELVNTGKQTTSIMVGPTVIMSDLLLKDGHTELAGRIVADIEKAKFAVRADARQTFGEAFAMARLKKQEK